jgi:hypothetical protein
LRLNDTGVVLGKLETDASGIKQLRPTSITFGQVFKADPSSLQYAIDAR